MNCHQKPRDNLSRNRNSKACVASLFVQRCSVCRHLRAAFLRQLLVLNDIYRSSAFSLSPYSRIPPFLPAPSAIPPLQALLSLSSAAQRLANNWISPCSLRVGSEEDCDTALHAIILPGHESHEARRDY